LGHPLGFQGNDPRFIYYFLKTKDFSSLNSGAAQPSLNRNFVHTVMVTIPGPNEQTEIANILSPYDDLIENNRRRIALRCFIRRKSRASSRRITAVTRWSSPT
jgi:restriction endonuclease S subunit